MQDSLCGSINIGVGGGGRAVPRSASQISLLKDFMVTDAPPSPVHRSLSSSDMTPACDSHAHLHSDRPANYSSSSGTGDQNMPSLTNHEWPNHHDNHQTYPIIPDDALVVAPQEPPESPNSSSYCWISDMIDELTEAPLHDSPMLCSPSHESSTLHTFTSSYSSFSDNFNDRQDLSGSPSILPNTSMQLPIYGEGVESPNSSHQFHQAEHFSSQHMQKLGSNHANNRQVQALSYGHDLIMQAQHQHQRQHESNQKKLEAKAHLSHYNHAGQRTMMQAKLKLPIGQPSNALPKALSAPQLSKLDPTKSPRWNSPLQFPLAPQANTVKKTNALQMSRAEYSSFLKRNSMVSSATTLSSAYFPDSPPRSFRPSSLPSQLGYLSHRIGANQARQTHPRAHPHGRPPSLRQNTSMPPMSSLADKRSQLRETMAPLQQSSNLPMLQHLPDMQQHDSGLRLVHLLLACAEAVAKENYFEAKEILLHLKQVVSKQGDSMQRVAAYFTDALHSRLTGAGSRSYMALRSFSPATDDEVLAAYQILYQACPYVKFAHFTSNQAIFEAFEEERRVHIVDLDIIQGYQWPAFIQALAARPGGAPRLRITGVGMPFESVQETGKRLSELAESLHVPFEFHPVGERLENLKSHMLHRRMGEALAINSVFRLHRLLSEPMSPLFGVLHMLREQAPSIFTLVEFEASHNGPFFLGRFLEALHYYSAIFDSLDATLPQTSPERAKVEQLVFSHEITNIVACEGGERVERHERLEKWRKMMEGMGFENVALSPNALNQSKLLLGLYPCDGYTLVEDRGGLLLGWQERPVIAASAWR